MSRRELANSYVQGYLKKEIDRRTFIKLMAGLGVSLATAAAFATQSEAVGLGIGKGKGKGPL